MEGLIMTHDQQGFISPVSSEPRHPKSYMDIMGMGKRGERLPNGQRLDEQQADGFPEGFTEKVRAPFMLIVIVLLIVVVVQANQA